MGSVFEKPSVDRLVTGGTYVLVFGIFAGLIGWLFIVIASRNDIGVGGDLLGYITVATSLHVLVICISGGFHQGLSKYLSESLVESKEKAHIYAKSAFFIFNLIGLILFSIFFVIMIFILPNNLPYGLVFGLLAIISYLTLFKDNFLGNLAAVHRFDYIGKMSFLSGVAGVVLGCFVLFLLPRPINAYLLPLMIIANLTLGIILLFYYGKKVVPYSLFSVFKGARRQETIDLIKYGFYCTVPNIIFSGVILWIQNLYYSGFFGFEEILVSSNGLIIGYAGVVFAICNFGWPQIPAVSEAKAQKNYKLIDAYMKNTLHMGFNLTAFFLVIYVGLSHQLLLLFHGSDYLIAHIPFILLSFSVAILGVEFLICTLLMGLGEGKKAALLIACLTLCQIILVPILILILKGNFGPLAPETLYAGPSSLLITSIATLPLALHYLKTHTNNPVKVYLRILGKGTISIALTLICYGLLDLLVFPHNNTSIELVLRGATLFGFFVIFLAIFGGFYDKDLDLLKRRPFTFIVKGLKWLLHHSPFYEPTENGENNGI